MMAPPGYPKITSTPASSRVRHRICAPVSVSVIGSHSPEVDGVERAVLQLVGVARLVEGVQHRARARLDDVGRRAVPRQRLDRKSTRLNSSHSQISYAVFCLKKKNVPLNSTIRIIHVDEIS